MKPIMLEKWLSIVTAATVIVFAIAAHPPARAGAAVSPEAASPSAIWPFGGLPDDVSRDGGLPDAVSPDHGSQLIVSPDVALPNAVSPDAASPDGVSPSGEAPLDMGQELAKTKGVLERRLRLRSRLNTHLITLKFRMSQSQ